MSHEEQAEDRRRRNQLVESVLGLVERIALKLAMLVGLHWLEELRSAGHLGATQAASVFDFASSTPFEGFSWPRIFGAMIDFLRKQHGRLPPKTVLALEQAAAVLASSTDYAALVRDKGEDITEEETNGIAAAGGIGRLWSGEPPPDPESQLLAAEARSHVLRGLTQLRERDRVIVQLRDFEHWTFKKIAEHFGIEEEAARKRYHDAVRRLGAIVRPLLLLGA